MGALGQVTCTFTINNHPIFYSLQAYAMPRHLRHGLYSNEFRRHQLDP